MLIQMKITNFLSFGDHIASEIDRGKAGFSMIASSERAHPEHVHSTGNDNSAQNLLKLAMLFGANGSGKSSFIQAAEFIQHSVLYGLPKGSSQMFNRTKAGNCSKPSCFQIRFRKGNRNYQYGFEVLLAQRIFLRESLYEMAEDGREIPLFERDLIRGCFAVGLVFGDAREQIQRCLEESVQENTILLLTDANRHRRTFYKKYPEAVRLEDAYKWFKDDLCIWSPVWNRGQFIESDGLNISAQFMKVFGNEISALHHIPRTKIDFLGSVPISMRDQVEAELERIQMQDKSCRIWLGLPDDAYLIQKQQFSVRNDETIPGLEFYQVFFQHADSEAKFRLSDESDGTRRLIELLILFLNKRERTYFVDDFGRSWHPLLTKRVVEVFTLMGENTESRQLIAATHEHSLLDVNLLRKDEIWLLTKEDNESHIERLNAFEI